MEDVPRDSRSELCGDTLIKTHREIVYVNLSSEIKLLISEFSCFCYIWIFIFVKQLSKYLGDKDKLNVLILRKYSIEH